MNNKDISKYIKFIALALLLFFPITAIAVEKAQVTSRSPITMSLKKQQSLSVQGATVHNARSVSILSLRNQTFKQFATKLSCKPPSRKGGKGSCNVKLTLTKEVPIGRYTLRLLDAKRQILATGKFEVKADATVAKARAPKKKQVAASRKPTQAAKRTPDNQKKKTLGTNQRAGINKRQALSPRKKGDVAKKLPIRPTRKQQAVASQKAGAGKKQTLGSLRKANKTRKFTASNEQEASRKKALLTDKTGVVAKKRELTTRRTNELVAKRQAVTGRRKAEAANPSMKQADAMVGGVTPLGRQMPGNISQRGVPGASVPNINEGLPGSGNAGMESPEEILARIRRAGGGTGKRGTGNQGALQPEEVQMPGSRDIIVADSRGNILLQLPGFKSSHTIGACEALTVPIAPVGGTPPYQVTATGLGDWMEAVQNGTGFEVVFPGGSVGNDYSFAIEIRDAAGRFVNRETVIQVRGNPPPLELRNVMIQNNGDRPAGYPVTYNVGGEYVNAVDSSSTLFYNCGNRGVVGNGVYQNTEVIGTYSDGSRYFLGAVSPKGIPPFPVGKRSASVPMLDRLGSGRGVAISIAYDGGESNKVTVNLPKTIFEYRGKKFRGPGVELGNAVFGNNALLYGDRDPVGNPLFGTYEMKHSDFATFGDDLKGETVCGKTFVRYKDVLIVNVFGTTTIQSRPDNLSILGPGNMPVVGWFTLTPAGSEIDMWLSGEVFTGACTNRTR